MRHWLDAKGMRFLTGPNPETDLTDAQILEQCKMYIAALRIADDFGCDVIGIQYQQGLKDLAPASDLAEGLLNNVDRPPVQRARNGRMLYEGQRAAALQRSGRMRRPGCAGHQSRVDAALGFDPETTLHDVRYGERTAERKRRIRLGVRNLGRRAAGAPDRRIRGRGERAAASHVFPPGRRHHEGRQQAGRDRLEPRLRGRRPLKADIGRGRAIELPREETERRWRITTPQWPMMHAVLYGISRDQFMARHKAEPHPGGLRARCRRRPSGAGRQGRHVPRNGAEVAICGTGHGP